MNRSQAAASPVPIQFGEQEFRVCPLTDEDRGELDNWVRARYLLSVYEAMSHLPVLEAQKLFRQASDYVHTVTWESSLAWEIISKIEFFSRWLWQSIRRTHPDWDLQRVKNLVMRMAKEQPQKFVEFEEKFLDVTLSILWPYVEREAAMRTDLNAEKLRDDGTTEKIYQTISERWGWSPQVIAQMTAQQQLLYLRAEPNEGTGLIRVDTVEEAQALIADLQMRKRMAG